MIVSIYKEYRFEAAHRLPFVHPSHKCHNLHGHNFKVRVFLSGTMSAQGWLMDFFELDALVAPLVEMLDHQYLNEIEGLENPTSEVLAVWFWERIKPFCAELRKVEVSENDYSGASYKGEIL